MSNTGETGFDPLAEDYEFAFSSRRYDEVLNFLPKSANRALDAGCGSGILVLQLAEHVNYVVGLDISRSMIALAKKHQADRSTENVDFVVADLEHLPFDEGSFHFVASNNALHDTQLEVTLPGLRRLVESGRRMALSDIVSSHPRLAASPALHVLRVLRSAPKYAVSHGLTGMWRVISFRLSAAWIQHVRSSNWMTPDSFRDIYGRFLPGCRCERHRWRMTAFWEAPDRGN